MVDYQHVSEYFVKLDWRIWILDTFEERNKHVEFPIIVKFLLIQIYFENFDDGLRLERTDSILHQRQKFLFHLWWEMLVWCFVIPQKEFLKLVRGQFIQGLFYFVVHFLPKLYIFVSQSFHQIVYLQVICLFNSFEILMYWVQGFWDPKMLVPVMEVLVFYLWKILKPLNHFVVL